MSRQGVSTERTGRSAIVIGGGVIGITTAYCLAKEGWKVTVLERESDAGLGTSRANGGLVSLGLGHPWNSPSTPLTVLRWLGREQSPFLLRAKALPGMASWGLRFLLNCRPAARSEERRVGKEGVSTGRFRGSP